MGEYLCAMSEWWGLCHSTSMETIATHAFHSLTSARSMLLHISICGFSFYRFAYNIKQSFGARHTNKWNIWVRVCWCDLFSSFRQNWRSFCTSFYVCCFSTIIFVVNAFAHMLMSSIPAQSKMFGNFSFSVLWTKRKEKEPQMKCNKEYSSKSCRTININGLHARRRKCAIWFYSEEHWSCSMLFRFVSVCSPHRQSCHSYLLKHCLRRQFFITVISMNLNVSLNENVHILVFSLSLSSFVVVGFDWRQPEEMSTKSKWQNKCNTLYEFVFFFASVLLVCFCHNVYMTLTKSIACIILRLTLYRSASWKSHTINTARMNVCHKWSILAAIMYGVRTRIIHNESQIDLSISERLKRKRGRKLEAKKIVFSTSKSKSVWKGVLYLTKNAAKTINQSEYSKDFRVETTLAIMNIVCASK